ncbi:MAG: hypothetical protein H7X93_03760, partial [Sphingomonadaceae bacterium]|nr:hypothetical protein [Sphingomonadaceae bacterium]
RMNEELQGTGRVLVRPSGTEPVVRVLALHRTVDHREHLPRLDPVAVVDEDARDLAALAGDADWHLAARRERSRRREDVGHRSRARHHHRDARQRLLLAGPARGLADAAAHEHECEPGGREQPDQDVDDPAPAPPLARQRIGILHDHIIDRLGAAPREALLEIHPRLPSTGRANPAPLGRCVSAIAHKPQVPRTGRSFGLLARPAQAVWRKTRPRSSIRHPRSV